MISREQIERCEREFAHLARLEDATARAAELELQRQAFLTGRDYSLTQHRQSHADYINADYIAESRAWILSLIRDAMKEPK